MNNEIGVKPPTETYCMCAIVLAPLWKALASIIYSDLTSNANFLIGLKLMVNSMIDLRPKWISIFIQRNDYHIYYGLSVINVNIPKGSKFQWFW